MALVSGLKILQIRYGVAFFPATAGTAKSKSQFRLYFSMSFKHLKLQDVVRTHKPTALSGYKDIAVPNTKKWELMAKFVR